MTTKESLNQYIEKTKARARGDVNPIFKILLFKYPDKEEIDESGTHSDFSGLGTRDDPGFFYDLDDAIECMNTNECDIHEKVFDAGFILCLFPGLYSYAGPDARMYFVWDEEREGFFQAEEPEIFRHEAFL